MLSRDIFNNYYPEESFFFFLSFMLSARCGSASPAFALEVIWLGHTPRPRATGRLAHPPSAAARLSHGRCQAARLSRADLPQPPTFTALPLAIRTSPAA